VEAWLEVAGCLNVALIGWGMEAAIAFAPLNHWWEALRLGYEVSCQSADEWLMWAEDLPLLSDDYRSYWWPPLGSRFHREHRWVRERLSQGLFSSVSKACLGACFGPNYGMQLTGDVFTPDMVMQSVSRLSENTCHNCYMEGAADLVIEVVLPEQADIDSHVRRQYYERGEVKDYWVVEPVAQQVQFWQWSPEGYRLQTLDSDGCYRGVPGLSFSPEIFFLDSLQLQRNLPAFTSSWQERQWEFQFIEGEELSWDSVPFVPTVGLQRQSICPEHFNALSSLWQEYNIVKALKASPSLW